MDEKLKKDLQFIKIKGKIQMNRKIGKRSRKLKGKLYTCKSQLASIALLEDKYEEAVYEWHNLEKKYNGLQAMMNAEAKQQIQLMKEASSRIAELQEEKAEVIRELNEANAEIKNKGYINARRMTRIAELEESLRIAKNNNKLLLFCIAMLVFLVAVLNAA